MTFQHTVLWMDHRQALVIGLRLDLTQFRRVRNDGHHLHGDRDSVGSRTERDRTYFSAVAEALGETPAVLLLGPGHARIDFLTWLQTRHPGQARHVLKSIPWDHVSDEKMVEEGRCFFHAANRMLPHPFAR